MGKKIDKHNNKAEQLAEFGRRLREARQELKMLQKDFALHLDVQDVFLSELEEGKVTPGFDLLRKLYTLYNINLHFLLNGEGEAFVKDDLSKALEPEEKKVKKKNIPTREMLHSMEMEPQVRDFLLEQFDKYVNKETPLEDNNKKPLDS
jgi:transcriptional regulator with XRE-family HTH domain